MNIFLDAAVANEYDRFYTTTSGCEIDRLEKESVKDLMHDVPKGKMLEIGCGTGQWTRFFVDEGFNVTGIDTSEKMLDQARAKEIDAIFHKTDVQDLPFNDCSFDAVAAITVLEFVDNQARALHEMHRVLKPGGWIILGCLNAKSVLGRNKMHDPVFKHGNFSTPKEWQEKLSLFSGFAIAKSVFLTSEFLPADETSEAHQYEPAFLAIKAQKSK